MGAVTAALASAARRFGCELRTDAAVARIAVAGGRAAGVVLRDGTELRAPIVVTATHPKIAFLDQVEREHLPPDFVADIERWSSRSGTVKVNVVVDRLPEFTAKPGFDADVHGGTIVLAPSLDYLEAAFQSAASGVSSPAPFADICIPTVFDKTLAPDGEHIVSMFTQWVPWEWAAKPMASELEQFADAVVGRLDAVAPGFEASIRHRQVIGPHEMEQEYGLVGGNIFHGELSANQLFHMRPAPGYADFRTPVAGLYQASSATHGGGGVTGIPGRNAVRQVLADRRRAARWPEFRRSRRPVRAG
jgi:phytoene dehydrogenase-like protein